MSIKISSIVFKPKDFPQPIVSGFILAYSPRVETLWSPPHNEPTLNSLRKNATTHQTIGVAQIPSCQDVTLYMKPKLSPSVLHDLPMKCKPWLQAVPCRAVPCCAALCWSPLRGILGLCAGTLLFTFTYTVVAVQHETSCQESSSLTNHPGYPFSSLAPCPANVKGTGFCSAQTRLFLSQLTEDGLTSQLQSLIIPSYCLKSTLSLTRSSFASLFILEPTPVLHFLPQFIQF